MKFNFQPVHFCDVGQVKHWICGLTFKCYKAVTESQNHRILGVGGGLCRSSPIPKDPTLVHHCFSVTASALSSLFPLPPVSISASHLLKSHSENFSAQLCCSGLGRQAWKQRAGWWDHVCTGLYNSFLPEISVISVYHKPSLVICGVFFSSVFECCRFVCLFGFLNSCYNSWIITHFSDA